MNANPSLNQLSGAVDAKREVFTTAKATLNSAISKAETAKLHANQARAERMTIRDRGGPRGMPGAPLPLLPAEVIEAQVNDELARARHLFQRADSGLRDAEAELLAFKQRIFYRCG